MEIEYNLNLDLEELKTLDNHSVLNILNVVVFELLMFSEHCGECVEVEPLLTELQKTADSIAAGTFDESYISNLNELKVKILTEIASVAENRRIEKSKSFTDTFFNIRSIFEILEIRIRELNDRKQEPKLWKPFSAVQLEHNLVSVFDAMATNSKGKYGFVYDSGEKGVNDYMVSLCFKGDASQHILMPPVFEDVLRDLSANARKYTAPGGELKILVVQNFENLEIEIGDTGIGIPEDEIPAIIGFGYRAKNVNGKRTFGGGFGLTKAFYLVQLFSGKMWIDSRTGDNSGTTIRIVLPVPRESGSVAVEGIA